MHQPTQNKKMKNNERGDRSETSKSPSIYGPNFDVDWPAENFSPNWIKKCVSTTKVSSETDVDTLIAHSSKFPIPFPIGTGRCTFLKNKMSAETMHKNINSTYPVVHERVLNLYQDFLEHKRSNGTEVEKAFYVSKVTHVLQLVDRLLKNRAVSFFGPNDKYLLLSKKRGIGKWETIGTNREEDLHLADTLSYDEVKLSALLYVTGYTHFVNNGTRTNCGVTELNRKSIEENGVIIGLIGARLKRKGIMEYQDIIVTKEQNCLANGYSKTSTGSVKMWADFYQSNINLYDEVVKLVKDPQKKKEASRYFPARAKDAFFDNMIYKKRLSLPFDTLILEADHRAREASKKAYIHMVGIGLGVWKNAEHQEPAFLEVFVQRLNALRNNTHNISDVHFAYFNTRPDDQVKDGMTIADPNHPTGGVKIHISKREPASKLTGEHEGKLLIVTYPWDGNAQPGNEYWMGMIKSTGDSAAASSTQITELHNAHINKLNVSAANLHIASRKYGIIHHADYIKKVNEEHRSE